MGYRYFTDDELRCKCGCGQQRMQPDFMRKMDELRAKVGFPLPLTSAYRCSNYNAKVSSTGPNGPHTSGRAVDIAVDRKQAYILLYEAMLMGFTGIGIQQKGNGRFIHLDDLTEPVHRPRPTIWSY